MKSLEDRIKELENSVKLAKAFIGAFGLSSALLFGYVYHLKGTAEEASKEVNEAQKKALIDMQKNFINQVNSINDKGLDTVAFIEDRKSRLFTEKCDIKKSISSCSNRNEYLTCPKGYYVKAVKNRGGSNSCPIEITCCSLS